MGRLFWSLAFVLAFLLGLSAAGMILTSPSTGSEVDRLKEMVTRLEQQVATLQARLRARDSVPGPRPSSSTAHADMPPFSSKATTEPADRIALGAVVQDATSPDRDARRGTAAQPLLQVSRGDQRHGVAGARAAGALADRRLEVHGRRRRSGVDERAGGRDR